MGCRAAGFPVIDSRGDAGLPFRAAGYRGFDPRLVAGCVLYLDPALGITLNGSTVSAWANQGTAGGSVSQGTGAAQPTWSATGFGSASRPYLSFDGTGDYLDLALGAVGTAYTFVFAVRYRAYVASDCIATAVNGGLNDYNAATTAVFGHVNAGTGLEHYVNGARGVQTRPTVNTPAIVSTTASGTQSTVRVNGTAGTPVALTGASLNAATLRFGARSTPGAANYSDVDIAEAIGFARALTAAELAWIERGIAGYCGITVA